MLVESSGLLIPPLSFLNTSWARPERVDDRRRLLKSGDPGSDLKVVGKPRVDLGDGRLEFRSPVAGRRSSIVLALAPCAASRSNSFVAASMAASARRAISGWRWSSRRAAPRSASCLRRCSGRLPIKVVSERLGHATPGFTMATYQHVIPGMHTEAAHAFAGILEGCTQPPGSLPTFTR